MKGITHKEPSREDIELTEFLHALSDKIRLQIVMSLAHGEEIAWGYFPVDAPKSSLSHHFRVLRTSGVIATRKEGTTLFNRLRRIDIDARFPGLLKAVLKVQKPNSEGTESLAAERSTPV